MSSYGGASGGRTRMGVKVYLNVYDLSPANDYLYPVGFGLHHSGVEVLGTEYTFASGAGIFDHQPRNAPGAKFRERLELGIFEGTQADVNNTISDLRSQFGPNSYNLITKNCNSFSNCFVWALLRRTIPPYVNRLADIGSCCSCLLPQKMLEAAPVGDNSNNNNSSGYQVYGGQGRIASFGPGKNEITRPFVGSGNVLGSSSSSSTGRSTASGISFQNILSRGSSISGVSTNNGKGVDDLTDRREKARKAALARLDRNGTNDEQKMK